MTTVLLALLLVPGERAIAPAEQLGRAERLLDRGRTAEAAELIRPVAQAAARDGDQALQARAENLLGGALIFSGDYESAGSHYRAALALYRRLGNQKKELDVLNNLASVAFFQGRYAEAWDTYAQARVVLNGRQGEAWWLSALQLTEVNQAALLQKLGRHEDALRLYQEVRQRAGGLTGPERARMLGNYGALLRRLGDPVKAVATYREALSLRPDLDTELGIRKNLGIALAMDLDAPEEAVRELDRVAAEAGKSGNARESLQARLYAAEALRRSGLPSGAAEVVQDARRQQLPEELWKALLVQAREEQSPARADEAVAAVESLRPGKRSAAPRASFLQDRAEAYDLRIALLQRESAGAGPLLYWQERLRARVLEEDMGGPAPDPSMARRLQQRLQPGEALWAIRIARGAGSSVWLTAQSERGQWFQAPQASLVSGCWSELRNPSAPTGACRALRETLPSTAPEQRVYVVSDGPLALFPFETFWGTNVQVVHLPSARWLLREAAPAPWTWPWTRTAAGLAPDLAARRLPGDDRWKPLRFAREEVADLAARLPGRNSFEAGASVGREALRHRLADSLLVHVAAHAAADSEDPARARVLFSDGYLFPAELREARFPALRLVTLSACESALGPQVDGEGLQNWTRLFLAQGAQSAVGTVWQVDDEAAFLFMQRFYRGVARGLPVAHALAEAKTEMAQSGRWRHPSYWAGFVLSGSPEPAIRPIPWLWMAALAAGALVALTVWQARRRGN